MSRWECAIEALARFHAIFVDHAKRSEAHVIRGRSSRRRKRCGGCRASRAVRVPRSPDRFTNGEIISSDSSSGPFSATASMIGAVEFRQARKQGQPSIRHRARVRAPRGRGCRRRDVPGAVVARYRVRSSAAPPKRATGDQSGLGRRQLRGRAPRSHRSGVHDLSAEQRQVSDSIVLIFSSSTEKKSLIEDGHIGELSRATSAPLRSSSVENQALPFGSTDAGPPRARGGSRRPVERRAAERPPGDEPVETDPGVVAGDARRVGPGADRHAHLEHPADRRRPASPASSP